ncbi:MAG TPA: hypothetical protein VFV34_13400 [Blastocatellia bacterium]|nr:hypothetical protein [Blastocatellia bacterium]
MIETPGVQSVPGRRSYGSTPDAFDRFATSRAAQITAFVWGFAEATFLFLVPDVFLTFIAVRALKPAMRGTLLALAGALTGGAIMYAFGLRAPGSARAFLDYVPGITSELVARVERQVQDAGLVAVLLGPSKGIPYKIYAVEWGARAGDFATFMLISIPARYTRFFLTSIGANLIARAVAPWTGRRARIEVALYAFLWVAFYSFYFARFGF